jgi:hypothetical protein
LAYSENYEKLLEEEDSRVIISYGRKHGSMLNPELPGHYKDYLIDSGGFQIIMDSAEREITVGAYTMWLQFILDKFSDKVSGYMSLDLFPKNRKDREEVLRTVEESVQNTDYMFKEGLKPIPVWKTFWPDDVLDYYCSLSRYVGIGGLVGYQGGKQALRHMFERIYQKYPDNVFHMLGVGIRAVIAFKTFRPQSIDFSTWTVAARFGMDIVNDDKQYLKEVSMSKEDKKRALTDKVFLKDKLRIAIRSCNSLETILDSSHEPHQSQMFTEPFHTW